MSHRLAWIVVKLVHGLRHLTITHDPPIDFIIIDVVQVLSNCSSLALSILQSFIVVDQPSLVEFLVWGRCPVGVIVTPRLLIAEYLSPPTLLLLYAFAFLFHPTPRYTISNLVFISIWSGASLMLTYASPPAAATGYKSSATVPR